MSLFSRLRRSSSTAARPIRSKTRRLSSEPLEERALLAADLTGYYLNVAEDGAVAGSGVTVTWGVWNIGNSNAGDLTGGFYVNFYAINSNNVASFRGSEFVGPLAANGGSFSKSTAMSLPPSNDTFWTGTGSYKLAMYVDAYNNIGESNESNNYNSSYLQDYDYVYVTVLPDLTADGITVSGGTNAKPGDSLNILFNVRNQASAAAGSFQARVYLSTNDFISTFDHLLGSIDLSFGLSANTSTGVGFYGVNLPGASDPFWSSLGSQSTLYVGVVLDPLNQVAESNEFNNDNRGLGIDVVQITLAPRPNLRAWSLSIDNANQLQAGAQGTFSYSVGNVGGGVAPASFAGLYLSRDATITTADRFLRSVSISSLGTDDTQSGSNMSFVLPDVDDAFWDDATGDTYYLGLISDYDGALAETSETDNANLGQGIDVAQVTVQLKVALADLPSTGLPRGAVLSAFLTQLKQALNDAASEQNDMRLLLKRYGKVATSERELRSLAAGINQISNQLKRLINGRATSVTLGRGVTADVNDLDLLEKTIWFVFGNTAGGAAAALMSAADARASIAADGGLWEYVPGYQTYKETKKWVEEKAKQIGKIVDAVTSAPSKAYKFLTGLLGGAAKAQGEAKQEAQAVQEAGPDLQQRMEEMRREDAAAEKAYLDNLLTGAPFPYDKYADKLEQIMQKYDASRAELQNDIIELGGFLENNAVLGFWEGTVSRDGLSGDISIYFQPSTNQQGISVKGRLSHTFYDQGGARSRTTGSFQGNMVNGVFRGTATISNSSGSGSFNIAWTFKNGTLGGTLYEGQTIMFNTTLTRR